MYSFVLPPLVDQTTKGKFLSIDKSEDPLMPLRSKKPSQTFTKDYHTKYDQNTTQYSKQNSQLRKSSVIEESVSTHYPLQNVGNFNSVETRTRYIEGKDADIANNDLSKTGQKESKNLSAQNTFNLGHSSSLPSRQTTKYLGRPMLNRDIFDTMNNNNEDPYHMGNNRQVLNIQNKILKALKPLSYNLEIPKNRSLENSSKILRYNRSIQKKNRKMQGRAQHDQSSSVYQYGEDVFDNKHPFTQNQSPLRNGSLDKSTGISAVSVQPISQSPSARHINLQYREILHQKLHQRRASQMKQ